MGEMLTVTIDQSEGISGAGIPEQAVKKMRTGSDSLSLPSPRAFFAFLFTLNDFSPLSRSLEQATCKSNTEQYGARMIHRPSMIFLVLGSFSLHENSPSNIRKIKRWKQENTSCLNLHTINKTNTNLKDKTGLKITRPSKYFTTCFSSWKQYFVALLFYLLRIFVSSYLFD